MVEPAYLADTLSKTELVRQLKQAKISAPEIEQRLAKAIVRKKITDDAEKTRKAEESDLLIISEEGKDKHRKQTQKREKSLEEDDQESEETSSEGQIDIEV